MSETVVGWLVSSGWALAWEAAGSQVQVLGHGGRQAGWLEQRPRRDFSEGLLCQDPGMRPSMAVLGRVRPGLEDLSEPSTVFEGTEL